MNREPLRYLPMLSLLALAACGGDGFTEAPNVQQRTQAVIATVQSNAQCTGISGFYWEIGDGSGALASGSGGNSAAPAAGDTMLIASASKWIYGAYVAQLRNGSLLAADIKALTMSSGYESLKYGNCIKLTQAAQNAETVDDCFHASGNDAYTAADDGKFFYNGGHFQKYADVDLGLGADNNALLQAAVAAQIGVDVPFAYDSPQLAAGVKSSASGYAIFLRKLLNNQLKLHDLLGSSAVCTNPGTCASAVSTPIPSTESWHYSLAHWVEDDPAVGDGAYSSPGAFGFYPWIDHGKTTYGILARYKLSASESPSLESVNCGRLIRRAWFTAAAQ